MLLCIIINSGSNLIVTNMNYEGPNQSIAVAIMFAVDFSIKTRQRLNVYSENNIQAHLEDIVGLVLDHWILQ